MKLSKGEPLRSSRRSHAAQGMLLLERNVSGPCGERASGLQPKAEAVGRVWTQRAGFSPFPVDPKGERSEFREAESSRKSIALSMAEHGPQRLGRRIDSWQRGGLGGIFAAPPVSVANEIASSSKPLLLVLKGILLLWPDRQK